MNSCMLSSTGVGSAARAEGTMRRAMTSIRLVRSIAEYPRGGELYVRPIVSRGIAGLHPRSKWRRGQRTGERSTHSKLQSSTNRNGPYLAARESYEASQVPPWY